MDRRILSCYLLTPKKMQALKIHAQTSFIRLKIFVKDQNILLNKILLFPKKNCNLEFENYL